MTNQTAQPEITLTIDKIAGLGDGVALHEGRKIFVPYTMAGDVVTARITKTLGDVSFARLESILTPGFGRTAPVCSHFGMCGGCTLQHLPSASYTGFKQIMAQEAVRKAGYDPACVAPLIAIPPDSRRRADLKVEEGKIGYYAGRSHELVDIEECAVLEPALFALVMELKSALMPWPEVTRIQINGVEEGYDVLLETRRGDIPPIASDAIQRLSLLHNHAVHTLYEKGPVTVILGKTRVELPPGAFLQASLEAQLRMTSLVVGALKGSSHVLDLFAGIGTYSFPLLHHTNVTAVESETSMARAIQGVSLPANSRRLLVQKRDLFQTPLTVSELKHFDGAVINPPRTGAKAQCEQLAQASVARLVMVSCNPATFTRDARILQQGGYQLVRLTPIDQFVYSPHLEIVAEFMKP